MDNPLRGITLILCATLLFSLSDSMAKFLGRTLHPVEISWIRYFTFVLMSLGLAWRYRRRRLRVRSPTLQVLRGLGLVGSALAYITALRYLPMAEASTLGFVSPLLITALSVPMLREVVGLRRWIAVVVGLAGVVIVMRPGMGMFQLGALFVMVSSTLWAFASVLTRRIAGVDDAAATMLWTSFTGFALLCLLLPFEFVLPSGPELALAILLGAVASAGQYLMTLAYRHAPASLLAPFSYSQLIWATALGYLVFGALPDRWTVLGAAVIVVSGFYTAHRERAARVAAS